MGNFCRASSWHNPTSRKSLLIASALSASSPLCKWDGIQDTTPKAGGFVSRNSSRSGRMRESTPPKVVKRKKPSSWPVTIKPTSSKCASSKRRGAPSRPHRRTPTKLPSRVVYTSSTKGRKSSAAPCTACVSKPLGPGRAHRRPSTRS